jgi:hypothetical protein
MASTTLPPGPTAHGGTAIGAGPARPRHLVGNALRAVRVFATTAVEVVLIGADGKRY